MMNHIILGNLFWLVTVWTNDHGCTQSLATIAYVKNCPGSKQQWIARAQLKRCDAISQQCSEENDFVYHCLLNEWGNATLEVCAPKRKVLGNCAEFNPGGGKIQNSVVECKQCPSAYESTEAFKYTECYDQVLKHSTNKRDSNLSRELNLSENGSSTVEDITLVLVLLQFILISIIIVVLVKCLNERSMNRKKCDCDVSSTAKISYTAGNKKKGKNDHDTGNKKESEIVATTFISKNPFIELEGFDKNMDYAQIQGCETNDTKPEIEDHLIMLDDNNTDQLTGSNNKNGVENVTKKKE